MQGVRWTEDDLKAHQARRASLRVVPPALAPTQDPEPLSVTTPAGGNRQAEHAAGLPLAGQRRGNATSFPNDAAAARRGVTAGETAPKRKPKRPEQDLHKACVQLLNAALLPFWRVVHVPNGGQRSPIEAAIMSSMGVRKGFPDLLLLGPNRFVVIELKAPGARGLTAEQAEWRDWFQHIGAMWFLVRSTEELEAACQDAGIPLRVRS